MMGVIGYGGGAASLGRYQSAGGGGDVWKGGRGVMFGGYGSPTPTGSNIIQYITIANTGNATDFGDLTAPRFGGGAVSNGSRACYGGGLTTGEAASNIIDYITIASTGNATDFGDLIGTTGVQGPAGCSSKNDRGLFCGGHSASGATNVIEYITITTTSDATDFGDLTNNIYFAAAAASFSRAVVAGGYNVNVIQYFATGTPGNAVDFGDLSGSRYALGACTNGAGYGADRAVFGGGYDGEAAVNTIEYVAVSTLGNATEFGELSVARSGTGACSGD